MRLGAAACGAMMLAGCHRSDDALLGRIAADTRLPACATFERASFRRGPGGRSAGGDYTVGVKADAACVQRWRTDLAAHGFRCLSFCARAAPDAGIAVSRRRSGVTIAGWSNT